MTPEQTANMLELIPTITLIDELQKRFDHFVVHGIQARPTADNPHCQNSAWRFGGNAHTCIGLAYDISTRIQLEIFANEKPMAAEDL